MIIRKIKALRDSTIKTKIQTKMFFEGDVDDLTFSGEEEYRNMLNAGIFEEANLKEPKATNITVDNPLIDDIEIPDEIINNEQEPVVWNSQDGNMKPKEETFDIPTKDDETEIEDDMPEELTETIDDSEPIQDEVIEVGNDTNVPGNDTIEGTINDEETTTSNDVESINLADKLEWDSEDEEQN